MESAEGGLSSFGESQLCEDVKTETWLTSDGGTLGSLGLVTSGLLMKTIKEEEPDDKNYICGGPSSSLDHITPVDQQNGEILQKPVKEEEPDDVSLYCEECRTFFINKCEVHGPALFISDTPVPMGVTDRARQTLPPCLEIRESGISDAGLVVFNKEEMIPVGAHFGPYEGDLVDKEEAMNSGYSWVIYKSGHFEEYIDAKRETHANWMRYVNCARNDKENNLVAFQYRGGIHYRCCRPVQSGQELLVWYEEEYAKDAGATFNHLWDKKSSFNEMANKMSFSCSLCLFSYTSQIYLHKHIKNCHQQEYTRMLKSGEIKYGDLLSPQPYSSRPKERKIYNCSKCGKNFSDESYFKIHRCIQLMKLHHCSQCSKTFTKLSHLKSHQLTHTEENPYQCLECGKSFKTKAYLQEHQPVHAAEKPYHCSQCGKGFTRKNSLDRHLFNHTEGKHGRVHTGAKTSFSEKEMDNNLSFSCSLCPFSFTSQIYLHKHIKNCHQEEYTRMLQSGEIKYGDLSYPQPYSSRPKEGEIYNCSKCGKNFSDESYFKTHRCIQSVKLHHCSECSKTFTKLSNLKSHQLLHTEENPYQCLECGKSFKIKAYLQVHQYVHAVEKPYHCSQCGKGFIRKSSLDHHSFIHTEEKPFHCEECGKGFVKFSGLKQHQSVHTGVKPFHCSDCGKSFCRMDHLKQHRRIHTGEKPYRCLQCGMSFTHTVQLHRHRRVHTSEKTTL